MNSDLSDLDELMRRARSLLLQALYGLTFGDRAKAEDRLYRFLQEVELHIEEQKHRFGSEWKPGPEAQTLLSQLANTVPAVVHRSRPITVSDVSFLESLLRAYISAARDEQ